MLDFCLLRCSRLISVLGIGLFCAVVLWFFTERALLPVPDRFSEVLGERQKMPLLARNHAPLVVSYQGLWNTHARVPLHEIPIFLQQAVIVAEDQRFYQHHGVDWLARFSALKQNLLALRAVRGASTLSEQVVRLLHPRPRTLWSRWLEGFEANRLEDRFSKSEILEFYLNQVPYAARRRGVQQAASYYFARHVSSLSRQEMMVLAALIRAPGRLDLRQGQGRIAPVLKRLGQQMIKVGLLDQRSVHQILNDRLQLRTLEGLEVDASHFVRYIQAHHEPAKTPQRTTLDVEIQHLTVKTLRHTLQQLSPYRVQHAAALVVDHQRGEILAWANVAVDQAHQSDIDAIITLRQPGSTLKPFAYALALEKGWTAATLIHDAPLTQMVSHGLHAYKNYSRHHYGWLRLRNALGNSLNIPAVRVAQFVGTGPLLKRLHRLGFEDLDKHPDFYGDGLVLGNGEVTLQQLVQAYSCLARGGECTSLKVYLNEPVRRASVFSSDISAIITDILSDPDARLLEFGDGGLMDFPIETALKTGTSNDFRDAWVVGFNHHYTIGIWMGNLDYQPTQGLSGARGPLLALRTLFAALNQREEPRPLLKDPSLVRADICTDTGLLANASCASRSEWFVAGTEPEESPAMEKKALKPPAKFRLRQPVQGLHVAYDPRLPEHLQSLALILESDWEIQRVEWWVDQQLFATTRTLQAEWPIARGSHQLQVRAWVKGETGEIKTDRVDFLVK